MFLGSAPVTRPRGGPQPKTAITPGLTPRPGSPVGLTTRPSLGSSSLLSNVSGTQLSTNLVRPGQTSVRAPLFRPGQTPIVRPGVTPQLGGASGGLGATRPSLGGTGPCLGNLGLGGQLGSQLSSQLATQLGNQLGAGVPGRPGMSAANMAAALLAATQATMPGGQDSPLGGLGSSMSGDSVSWDAVAAGTGQGQGQEHGDDSWHDRGHHRKGEKGKKGKKGKGKGKRHRDRDNYQEEGDPNAPVPTKWESDLPTRAPLAVRVVSVTEDYGQFDDLNLLENLDVLGTLTKAEAKVLGRDIEKRLLSTQFEEFLVSHEPGDERRDKVQTALNDKIWAFSKAQRQSIVDSLGSLGMTFDWDIPDFSGKGRKGKGDRGKDGDGGKGKRRGRRDHDEEWGDSKADWKTGGEDDWKDWEEGGGGGGDSNDGNWEGARNNEADGPPRKAPRIQESSPPPALNQGGAGMQQLSGSGGLRLGMPQLQTWMSAAKADESNSGTNLPQAMPSMPFQSQPQSQDNASSALQASAKKSPSVMALLERMESAGLIEKASTGPGTTGAISAPMTRPPTAMPLTIRPPASMVPSLTSSVVQRPTGGVIPPPMRNQRPTNPAVAAAAAAAAALAGATDGPTPKVIFPPRGR